jgi:NADH dehydrogenase
LKNGREIQYDYLVMALGSEPNYFGIDGMETHSKSFLSTDKAIALNKYFLNLIAQSKSMTKEEATMKLHTIIVGAGPSGVELAGALRPYLTEQAKKQGVDPSLITVDLLDSGPRVLPAIPEKASALVAEQLKKRGVTIYSNYGVNACDEDCVMVADKSKPLSDTNPSDTSGQIRMNAGTVIWTAGTKISTTFNTLPNITMTDRKRITVTPRLTLPSDDKIFIAGDGSGTPFSGLAQTAIDQGQYVAKTILARIAGVPVADYVPQAGIFVIPVGKGWAILNKKDFVVSGLAAWLIRILVDAKYFFSITSVGKVLSMLKKDQ